MGAARPFVLEGEDLTAVHVKERTLYGQVSKTVESTVPGVEVLALELLSPDRFCVYIDHPQGVDHALCERVTHVLEGFRREYRIDVSSPGFERPLRKPAHFRSVVGRKVALRTASEIEGRKRFRGELRSANERALTLATGPEQAVDIPYDEIVRGNLIDEG
jgi:ribosome maturation factor RimP